MGSFYEVQANCLDLFIWLQPNASRSEVVGEVAREIGGETSSEASGEVERRLKIKVQSPPVEGAANKALIKFISQKLKVAKSSVEIVAGLKSRKKTLRISFKSRSRLDENLEELILRIHS